MSVNETPRIRLLLRQAERNLESGKLVAAEELFEQVVTEAPENAAGWLGLAQATTNPELKQQAFENALALDGDNPQAIAGAAGEPLPPVATEVKTVEAEAAVAKTTNVPSTTPVLEVLPPEPARQTAAPTDTELVCYRHPGRSTALRCYKCSKPICSECTVKTPVGYLCPDCYREAEDSFFNAKPTDYLLALLVALPLSLLAGWLVSRFGSGFLFYIIIFFVGGAVGGFIGRMTKRVIGGRRGRYIPYLVAGCVIFGAVIFALPTLYFALFVNPGAFFSLIGPGIYLATAVSSAYFWSR